MTLEVWAPRFVQPWANCFAGALPPQVVFPDEGGEQRAPADVMVNGRAEFRRAGQEPILQPGDVLSNPLGEALFRVPTEKSPRWQVARRPEGDRSDLLSLLERQAAMAELDLSAPDARQLLGAARAWRLGALRCTWERGFVISARWSSAATVHDSMAWHLWQLLASPAGFGLETFSGTPVDAADVQATLDVVARFPAPRLREVVFETNERLVPVLRVGVQVKRAPLPWLRVERSGTPSEHVTLDGATNRLRVRWRQLVEVKVNGHTPDDRCLWHDGLWVELRDGDEVSWPGGGLRVTA
ncbi:MAG: hypothetical protein ACOZQL_22385 [Myxococcota bacterium]